MIDCEDRTRQMSTVLNIENLTEIDKDYDILKYETMAKRFKEKFDVIVNEVLDDTEQECATDGAFVTLSDKLKSLFNLNRAIFDTLMEAIRQLSIINSHYKRNYQIMSDMHENLQFSSSDDEIENEEIAIEHDQPPRVKWINAMFTPFWYLKGRRG